MPVSLRAVAVPPAPLIDERPAIPAEVFERRAKAAYARANTAWLVVYADREHFGNMAFLTDFEPRFEEAFLLLGPGDKRVLLVGNECESYAALARLPGLTVLRSQTLSLMAQDRSQFPRLADRFRRRRRQAGRQRVAGRLEVSRTRGGRRSRARIFRACGLRAHVAEGDRPAGRDAGRHRDSHAPGDGTALRRRRGSDRRFRIRGDAVLGRGLGHRRRRARRRLGVRSRRAHGLFRRPAERAHDVRVRFPRTAGHRPAQPECAAPTARRRRHDGGRLLGRAVVSRRTARCRERRFSDEGEGLFSGI